MKKRLGTPLALPTPEATGKKRALGMSKRRLLFVTGVIVFLTSNSLLDIAISREHWPFSDYPMYSEAQKEYSVSKPQLYGVTQEEPHREIPLRGYEIQPFDEGRLQNYFLRIDSEADSEKRQQLLYEALHDFMTQYERLRQFGIHNGPPLQGIKLYQLQWQLDPRAENVDQPDHRELLAEYEQD